MTNQISDKTKTDPARATIIAAIITSIASISVAIISGYYTVQANRSKEETIATNVVLGQVITQGESTQASLKETIAAPTATQVITPTEEFTPIPSPTIIVQVPGAIFSDDFEIGIKPEWDKKYGEVGMANGNFTVISSPNGTSSTHLAILGGYIWKNFSLKTTILQLHGFQCGFPCSGNPSAGIILRYNPNGTSIGLIIDINDGIVFSTMDRTGQWSLIANTRAPIYGNFNLVDNSNEIRVEANGNTYFVYVNNRKETSATIEGEITGEVGLWFQNSDSGKLAEWFAPRFSDFTIEGLP